MSMSAEEVVGDAALIQHISLQDPKRSLDFYTRVLGMTCAPLFPWRYLNPNEFARLRHQVHHLKPVKHGFIHLAEV